MKPLIKNMPREEAVALADLVQIQPGQVVSRTLAQNDQVSLTLFAFDKGEEISAHEFPGTPWPRCSAARGPLPWRARPMRSRPGNPC